MTKGYSGFKTLEALGKKSCSPVNSIDKNYLKIYFEQDSVEIFKKKWKTFSRTVLLNCKMLVFSLPISLNTGENSHQQIHTNIWIYSSVASLHSNHLLPCNMKT